jgi:hypothetical protein
MPNNLGKGSNRMTGNNYWNPIIETMGSTEQSEMQAEKLRWQLRYVLDRAPFYRRKFEEAGFDPAGLRDVADLSHAPFTHKEELRESQIEHSPLGEHPAVVMDEVLRVHSSSRGVNVWPSAAAPLRDEGAAHTEVVRGAAPHRRHVRDQERSQVHESGTTARLRRAARGRRG